MSVDLSDAYLWSVLGMSFKTTFFSLVDNSYLPSYHLKNIGRAWVNAKSKEEDLPKIRGDVLKQAREDKGIDAKDVALAVCLDKRHIFQIELGDDHYYFYSLKIKVQAAKRIGKYLELEESDYLYW